MRHLQVPASGSWDTKVYCACGDEFTSRAMFWKHQADAYVAMVDQWERIAAVVRASVALAGWRDKETGRAWGDALEALTPDDIEAVQP